MDVINLDKIFLCIVLFAEYIRGHHASDLIVSLFVLVLEMDIVMEEWSLCCFSLALTNLFERFGLDV